jgi:hypothetical protein
MEAEFLPKMFLLAFILFIVLIGTIIKLFSFCRIFSKAGYGWAFGLLILLPFAELVIPLVLALLDWPIQKKLRQS